MILDIGDHVVVLTEADGVRTTDVYIGEVLEIVDIEWDGLDMDVQLDNGFWYASDQVRFYPAKKN